MNLEEVKKAIYSFTYGVYLITTRRGTQTAAMTAVWVSQVSKDPVSLVVALSPESATTKMLLESKVFTVNVLHRGQQDLAYAMGRVTSDEVDKFAAIPITSKVTGAPVVMDAMAYVECKVTSHIHVGSHLIVFGEVIDGSMLRDLEPAIYRNGKIF